MFLLIDKPQGITSHDVIDILRKITGERRIGHAGTLDPNATGLLIVGVGRESTKKLGTITTNTTKTYVASVVLGETRETDDIEGEITSSNTTIKPSKEEIIKTLKKFRGELTQIPPIFSAIKKNGQKAYDLARSGHVVKMEARKVIVHKLELLQYEYPNLELNCEVSAGTYIRSLARDIGASIGTGAYLAELQRTKIGEFSLERAVKLDNLTSDNWKSFLVEL